MPKRLLRSIIEFDQEISPENLIRNFQRLRRAVEMHQMRWDRPEDHDIYRYATAFFAKHGEMPSTATLLDYFQSVKGLEAIERVKDIAKEPPYARANFSNLLRDIQEQQISGKAINLLKQAAEITAKGKGDQKGWDAAYELLVKEGQKLRIDDGDQILINQNIRDATAIEALKEEYQHAKQDKGSAVGVLCGINEIDNECMGIKKGDLWIHGAFPGELKTTFAVNWCYSAMTRFNTNVVFMSLEMPLEQIRRNFAALHTSNNRFLNKGFKPLDYRKIRYGTLTDEEETQYFDALEDFKSNPTYCTCEVVSPDSKWDINQVTQKLEMLHKEFEVGMVVIDHGQWLDAQEGNKSKDYTITMNSIIDDCKRLAKTFNHNEGIPVLLLWQINREGKSDADKHEGVYKASAFTYANNVEKTADVITTTYINPEMKTQQRTKFTCIKNRDGDTFQPFEAHVNFTCRRILSPQRAVPEGFSADGSMTELSDMDAMRLVSEVDL